MATFNKDTKIWSNPSGDFLYNPNLNIGEPLLHALLLLGDRVLQIDGETGITITAKEARVHTIRAAQTLQSLRIKEGDVIATATRILPHIPSVVIAGFLVGAPVNILDPGFQICKLSLFSYKCPLRIFILS